MGINTELYKAILISLIYWLVPHIILNIINIAVTTFCVWLVLYGSKNTLKITNAKERFLKILLSWAPSIYTRILGAKEGNFLLGHKIEELKNWKTAKLKTLKEYCLREGLILPIKGSGKNGKVIKSDILLAISNYYNNK